MNMNQFNLFKDTKYCKNEMINENDYYKNQEYLSEIKKAKEKYNDEVKIINNKYTYQQRILTCAFEHYIYKHSDYIQLIFAGLLMSIVSLIAMVKIEDSRKFIMILILVTGIVFLVGGINMYFKMKKFKQEDI